MTDQPRPDLFSDLPYEDQQRLRAGTDQITRLAYLYALPVLIGARTEPRLLSAGSCWVLRLRNDSYVATAQHVITKWRALSALQGAAGPPIMQVSNTRVDPAAQLAFEDADRDVAFLRLTPSQATTLKSVSYSPIGPWPPQRLKEGDYIVAAGYPAFTRNDSTPGEIGFGCLSSLHEIAAVGDGYAVCQFQREHWISTTPERMPPPGTELGGLSGGPVLLVGQLAYPIVGLVTEFEVTFELLRLATLDSIAWLADAASL